MLARPQSTLVGGEPNQIQSPERPKISIGTHPPTRTEEYERIPHLTSFERERNQTTAPPPSTHTHSWTRHHHLTRPKPRTSQYPFGICFWPWTRSPHLRPYLQRRGAHSETNDRSGETHPKPQQLPQFTAATFFFARDPSPLTTCLDHRRA